MPANLHPYPAYKDSGVPWLGQVPAHWEVKPSRTLFEEIKDQNHPDEPLLSVTIARGVIPQSELLSDTSKKDSSNLDKSKYKLVKPRDIAYNKMRAWQGAIGVSRHRGIVSPAYIVQRPRYGIASEYMHYLLRTPGFAKEAERWSYGITSDQWSLRPEHFKMIYCCLPPPDEQAAIARYLTHVDRRVRRFIRAKQALIKLLEEQKQAVIHQAVTRGLDPDAPLKESGVPWLGQVPAHWETINVRRLISFITSGSRGWAQFYSDDGELFIQSGNLGRTMELDFSRIQHVTPPPGAEGERTKIQRNDVLVCITGALTGNVTHVSQNPPTAFINQHVALLRPIKTKVLPRFLAYALYSPVGQTQFKTTEYGGTKQGLGLDDVRNVVLGLPPLDEQQRISNSLDLQLSNSNTAIDRLKKEIDLIREYRTRLIADVVTGKLDVRAAAASLPAEGEDDDAVEEWGEDEDVDEVDGASADFEAMDD